MRILLTADPMIPVPPTLYGGIERIVDGLVRELRVRGHEVALVAHADSTCAVEEFHAWAREGLGAVDSLRNGDVLRAAVESFRPDVVHSFSRLLYLLPLASSPIPRIMSYQRAPTARTVRWSRRIARGRLVFTGCSEYICRLGRHGGGTWHAIPNFVDPTFYRFEETVTDDAPLVFLSRVERIKGAHGAIRAARATGRRLIIAGNRVHSPEHDRYWHEEIAPHLGRDGIEYVGAVDDARKNALLGGAAAMIVPIEWDEPFGIVFAEALACGTPVISTLRGAVPEIVRDGVEGFLATSDDALAAAIRRLPEIDRRLCRRRVEEAFATAVVTDRYERLYGELCRGGRLRAPGGVVHA